MTQYELQAINHIFDKKSITFITPFSSGSLSLPQYELTIESLIRSGLLIDKNTFSEKGMLIAKRLKDYKAAKKYIAVNNFHFALLDDDTAILIYVTSSGEYELARLQTAMLSQEILQLYPEYTACQNSATLDKYYLSDTDLNNRYPKRTSILSIKTKAKGKPREHIIFFIDNEQIYLYEFAKSFLSPLSVSDFQSTFVRRSSV